MRYGLGSASERLWNACSGELLVTWPSSPAKPLFATAWPGPLDVPGEVLLLCASSHSPGDPFVLDKLGRVLRLHSAPVNSLSSVCVSVFSNSTSQPAPFYQFKPFSD